MKINGKPVDGDWRPLSEMTPEPGMVIAVRRIDLYRFHPYKLSGARQMNRTGRWQRANDHGGWDNAELPSGEFLRVPEVEEP